MSDERRYQDHEIREILELAERGDQARVRSLPAAGGLSAAELQEVGREVGMPADVMARAIAQFEGRGQSLPRSTTLGMPTVVGRMVDLPRAPTDQEWERLVADLRTTFGGKGVVTSQGGLREWSDGSLHAFIEPTDSGYRLRLSDSMPVAVGAVAMGGFLLAFALMILLVLLGKEDAGMRFVVPVFFALGGAGMIGGTRIALPRWADEREAQMEHITTRARALLDPAPANEARDALPPAD
jgi:hypothetical protein